MTASDEISALLAEADALSARAEAAYDEDYAEMLAAGWQSDVYGARPLGTERSAPLLAQAAKMRLEAKWLQEDFDAQAEAKAEAEHAAARIMAQSNEKVDRLLAQLGASPSQASAEAQFEAPSAEGVRVSLVRSDPQSRVNVSSPASATLSRDAEIDALAARIAASDEDLDSAAEPTGPRIGDGRKADSADSPHTPSTAEIDDLALRIANA